jgi:AraC-like DNA-binding protein
MQALRDRMTTLLRGLAIREGIHPTILEGVQLMRANRPLARTPVLYEPGIVIVGQGRKRGYLGDQVYTYDAHNYLVLSVPLPFECETQASPEKPMLAISIKVDLGTLAELLMKMDDGRHPEMPATPQGIYSTPLDARLCEAAVRLLELLNDASEARILGPQVVREITYRVLCGQQGGALRAAAALHSRFGQVNRALQRMHAEYARELSVQELAEAAGMSPSAFHQNFKSVTSTSPAQYLKTIRLHKARMLMVHEGLRAGVAAGKVGYQSPSQFSREFKRLFGLSPVGGAEAIRQLLGVPLPGAQQ